jgi:Uma2 family endonuclease
MATRARLTADDLLRMGGDDDVRHELIDGELVEMPRPKAVHGWICGMVCYRLTQHAERLGAGKVLVDVGVVLNLPWDAERVRGPDVAFIARERLEGGRLPTGFLRGAPDLVVEVLSPSETASDVQQKVRDYLEGGARLVWIVAPESRSLTVYRADGSARLVREGEEIDGEDVLPGMSLPLSHLLP